MKRILAFFLLISFVSLSAFNSNERKLPSVEVKTLEGKTVNIADYGTNDKMTIISFWATWCVPCKKELDAIAELYPDWVEDYDVELIAITTDNARSLPKVKPMVVEKGWEYTVLSDANQNLQRALNFQAVPHTLLIDKNGNIVYEHSGYKAGDEYELEDLIKELVDKP